MKNRKKQAVSILIMSFISLLILAGASLMVYVSISSQTNLTLLAEIVHYKPVK